MSIDPEKISRRIFWSDATEKFPSVALSVARQTRCTKRRDRDAVFAALSLSLLWARSRQSLAGIHDYESRCVETDVSFDVELRSKSFRHSDESDHWISLDVYAHMTPMSAYERLAEEKRTSRRTIADVLEVLREAAGFADYGRAVIKVGLLQLPSSQIVGLVQIFFRLLAQEKTYVVSLPTSIYFKATRDGASQREKFEISRLDGATVDGDGHVLLNDGARLRAVEVIPVRLPLEPSELDWRIVQLTVAIVGAEKRCYRRLSDKPPGRFRRRRHYKMPRRLRKSITDRGFLDCRALRGLKTPPLKELACQLSEKDPTLKKLSHQKIADTLRKFGVRIPISRPRRPQGVAASPR